MINRVYWNDLNLTMESTPIDITCLPGTVIDREWKMECACGQHIYWMLSDGEWELIGTKLVVEQHWGGDEYEVYEYYTDTYYCLGCGGEITPKRKSDGKGLFREFFNGPTYYRLNDVDITPEEAEIVLKVFDAISPKKKTCQCCGHSI